MVHRNQLPDYYLATFKFSISIGTSALLLAIIYIHSFTLYLLFHFSYYLPPISLLILRSHFCSSFLWWSQLLQFSFSLAICSAFRMV